MNLSKLAVLIEVNSETIMSVEVENGVSGEVKEDVEIQEIKSAQ